ncbi:MAG: hypothetical protein PVG11_01920, partial [Anaerolineae bacterium]
VLESAALEPGPVESGGGIVPVDLLWRVLAQPEGDYRVGLRLVGPTGHVWAQRDAEPLGGLAPFARWAVGVAKHDHHGLLVPAGTPPGDYEATLRVYHQEDLSVLPVSGAGGRGGELALGSIQVMRPATSRPADALDFAEPLDVTFGPLRLVGHRTATHEPLLPGEAVAVDLFWQAMADPAEDFSPWLRLVDDDGRSVAELVEKPVAGTYPTAWWQAGDLVRDPHRLVVPAPTLPGEYRLVVGLFRAADGAPVEGDGGELAVELGTVTVIQRPHVYEAPAPQHAQAVMLGESVALVGYDLDGLPARPGDALDIVLYWHALDTPDRNYQTFIHLLDGEARIVAQADGVPGQGRLPTRGWLPGEYVSDPHAIQLPPDLPPGEYHLVAGLYDPVTGYRPGEPVTLSVPVRVQSE